MNNMNKAMRLTERLFSLGSEPGMPCLRIQFMGGLYPDHEHPMGGLSPLSFQTWIYDELTKLEIQDES